MESTAELVEAFNKLDRSIVPETFPMPNYYVFGVQHISWLASGDIITPKHAFFPQHIHITGTTPIEVLSKNTPAEKARALVPWLLKAILKCGVNKHCLPSTFGDPKVNHVVKNGPAAPGKWVCVDAELAAALEPELRGAGVMEELCIVGVATKMDKIELYSWRPFLQKQAMKHGIAICMACCMPATEGTLQRCGSGKVASYCSRDCQKKDWFVYKKHCRNWTARRDGELFHPLDEGDEVVVGAL